MRPDDEPGAIWAFDLTLQRLTRFGLDLSARVDHRIISLAGPHRVLRAFWMAPDVIIGVGRTERVRFVRFDSAGQMTSEIPGVLLGDSTFPESVRQAATISGHQVCEQAGRGFAVLYMTIGRIALYD